MARQGPRRRRPVAGTGRRSIRAARSRARASADDTAGPHARRRVAARRRGLHPRRHRFRARPHAELLEVPAVPRAPAPAGPARRVGPARGGHAMRPDLTEWGGRLSSLADFEPPAAGWTGVVAARASREARLDFGLPVAVAAIVLAATTGIALWLQSARDAMTAMRPLEAAAELAVAADMRAENERLERILAVLPERHAMRGSTAFTVAELEDRLALVDDRLSRIALEPNAPERAEELWRERVG